MTVPLVTQATTSGSCWGGSTPVCRSSARASGVPGSRGPRSLAARRTARSACQAAGRWSMRRMIGAGSPKSNLGA
ncbi:hypothetical protein ETD85_57705 [Nonomuraea zeae]|uniref:Uncharacterized protein n=1 Tax=Nonomuraea zeae TaxID=1642303 RepID=A0A5S4F964_9ACTN|nr:hypothetical protein ETD85_57705 [Nonomuraea zeae]